MVADTTAHQYNIPAQIYSCANDVRSTLSTWSDASTLSKWDLLILFLALCLASLESDFETAAIIALFTINQDLCFDAHVLSIEVKTIACRQNIFNSTVEKCKP